MPKKLLFNNIASEIVEGGWREIELSEVDSNGMFKEREVLINGDLPELNTIIGTFLFKTNRLGAIFNHKRTETGTSNSIDFSNVKTGIEYIGEIKLINSTQITITVSNFETGEAFAPKTVSSIKNYYALMGIINATSVKIKI